MQIAGWNELVPLSSHVEDGTNFAKGPPTTFLTDPDNGNPASSIRSTSSSTDPGLIFTRVGGGLFTFDEFDFAAFADQPSDTVTFTGLLNSSQAFSFQISTSSSIFTTQPRR